MSLNAVALIAIVVAVTLIRFLIVRRRARSRGQLILKTEKDKAEFLATFNPSSLDDFSLLNFEIGEYSHCRPFPSKNGQEWRYAICLARLEAEDMVTIVHEITEFTIGRVIEALANLDKPLYLQRKQEDKYWVKGSRQKYGIEHVLTTLTEADDISHEKLGQRLAEEDIKAWLTDRPK